MAKCLAQNIHNRTEEELAALSLQWEACPRGELRLDIQPLLEWSRIAEIPVEDISNDELDDVDMEEGKRVVRSGGEDDSKGAKEETGGESVIKDGLGVEEEIKVESMDVKGDENCTVGAADTTESQGGIESKVPEDDVEGTLEATADGTKEEVLVDKDTAESDDALYSKEPLEVVVPEAKGVRRDLIGEMKGRYLFTSGS